MSTDIEAAVEMLDRLVRVDVDRRLDTLALVVKVFVENGNQWSLLRDVWGRIESRAALDAAKSETT